ncbi:hypothetical protein C5615_33840 [Burkholderia cepacia]|uniref:BON domain-containing protein n=1 Tax=Burkholderia cepacia TaxID=292 RepID=A0A2S8I793_BURCE|nr:BON domain-containing protein [Burkholderia cepacia]PQP10242.1 hypothetical protein C5615_33840 [Burkholderia cepacia]HDR9512043.1 BON domain-containing protein [Burkholderia cepacia]
MQSDIAVKIEAALIRRAAEQAGYVGITVQDGCVTLTGRVDSLRERRLAIDAAWPVPGVREVADQLLGA